MDELEEIVHGAFLKSDIDKALEEYELAKKFGDEAELRAKLKYAHCLVKSAESDEDIRLGVKIFQDLYKKNIEGARRDYLYHIAIGEARLKNYKEALYIVDQFLEVEPNNTQALKLKTYIMRELKKDGLIGMALTGGAVLIVGSLIGLGMSLAKR